MERSNHRVRTLPTEELVSELVVRLVDAMLDADLRSLESPRARRVFRELEKREMDTIWEREGCVCPECLGDLEPLDAGPDPFPST